MHNSCYAGTMPPTLVRDDEAPSTRPPVLDAPELDPEERLKLTLLALRRAFDEWDECQRIADDIDPELDPDGLEQARRNIRNAYRRWSEIADQAQGQSENLRRKALELPSSPEYQAQYQHTLAQLQGQFIDGGPHYDLLCERVAGLHVRLRQMETSGRSYAPAEHSQLNSQLLAYINQLQKYTEAMKSESISRESQAVAEAILGLVQRRLAASYPEMWDAIMHDVRGALEGARAA
jgi:hypothetical protein